MNAYNLMKGVATYSTDMLFRDIDVINADEIPREGPVIIYGNHNNQFIDGALLMRVTPRVISFVAAARSMRRPIIGAAIRMTRAIPLERAQDVAVPGPGVVTALKGDILRGRNTKFTTLQTGSSIECGQGGELRVKAIQSDEEVTVANEAKVEFEKDLKYKIIPKLEYNDLYKYIWESLNNGACIGIFPEGGSHDRSELLPLKAGICIMALGAMEKYGISVTLVSCGFTYYQPEKFRSKVLMEYGHPYTISPELVQLYRTDKRRAISTLLADVEENLKMVTLAFNKPESISTLFVSRQLYSLNSKPLTSKEKVELNRRFAKGFQILESSAEARAEAVQLFENIKSFEDFSKIYQLPIAYNVQRSSVFQDTVALVFYIVKCLNRIIFVLALITQAIPGVIFMGPMTSLVVYLSEKERVKCLKASKVKLHGNDVVGSYKIMVSLVLFPIFQIVNSLLTYFVLTKLDKFSVTTNRRIALAVFFLVPIYALIMVRSVDSLGQTFKKLKYMFIKVFKRDLLDTYEKNMRELSRAIRSAVDKFGGSVFTDFDDIRIIKKDELCQLPTPKVKKTA